MVVTTQCISEYGASAKPLRSSWLPTTIFFQFFFSTIIVNICVPSGMPIFHGKNWLWDYIRIALSTPITSMLSAVQKGGCELFFFLSLKFSLLITASSNAQWHAVRNQLIRLKRAHGVVAWDFNLLAESINRLGSAKQFVVSCTEIFLIFFFL